MGHDSSIDAFAGRAAAISEVLSTKINHDGDDKSDPQEIAVEKIDTHDTEFRKNKTDQDTDIGLPSNWNKQIKFIKNKLPSAIADKQAALDKITIIALLLDDNDKQYFINSLKELKPSSSTEQALNSRLEEYAGRIDAANLAALLVDEDLLHPDNKNVADAVQAVAASKAKHTADNIEEIQEALGLDHGASKIETAQPLIEEVIAQAIHADKDASVEQTQQVIASTLTLIYGTESIDEGQKENITKMIANAVVKAMKDKDEKVQWNKVESTIKKYIPWEANTPLDPYYVHNGNSSDRSQIFATAKDVFDGNTAEKDEDDEEETFKTFLSHIGGTNGGTDIPLFINKGELNPAIKNALNAASYNEDDEPDARAAAIYGSQISAPDLVEEVLKTAINAAITAGTFASYPPDITAIVELMGLLLDKLYPGKAFPSDSSLAQAVLNAIATEPDGNSTFAFNLGEDSDEKIAEAQEKLHNGEELSEEDKYYLSPQLWLTKALLDTGNHELHNVENDPGAKNDIWQAFVEGTIRDSGKDTTARDYIASRAILKIHTKSAVTWALEAHGTGNHDIVDKIAHIIQSPTEGYSNDNIYDIMKKIGVITNDGQIDINKIKDLDEGDLKTIVFDRYTNDNDYDQSAIEEMFLATSQGGFDELDEKIIGWLLEGRTRFGDGTSRAEATQTILAAAFAAADEYNLEASKLIEVIVTSESVKNDEDGEEALIDAVIEYWAAEFNASDPNDIAGEIGIIFGELAESHQSDIVARILAKIPDSSANILPDEKKEVTSFWATLLDAAEGQTGKNIDPIIEAINQLIEDDSNSYFKDMDTIPNSRDPGNALADFLSKLTTKHSNHKESTGSSSSSHVVTSAAGLWNTFSDRTLLSQRNNHPPTIGTSVRADMEYSYQSHLDGAGHTGFLKTMSDMDWDAQTVAEFLDMVMSPHRNPDEQTLINSAANIADMIVGAITYADSDILDSDSIEYMITMLLWLGNGDNHKITNMIQEKIQEMVNNMIEEHNDLDADEDSDERANIRNKLHESLTVLEDLGVHITNRANDDDDTILSGLNSNNNIQAISVSTDKADSNEINKEFRSLRNALSRKGAELEDVSEYGQKKAWLDGKAGPLTRYSTATNPHIRADAMEQKKQGQNNGFDNFMQQMSGLLGLSSETPPTWDNSTGYKPTGFTFPIFDSAFVQPWMSSSAWGSGTTQF